MVKAARELEARGRAARLFGRRASDAHPSRRGTGDGHLWDHHHRNIQGGGARAAVFGVSDGLVTNVSLILGFAGRQRRPERGAPGRDRRADRRRVLHGVGRVDLDVAPSASSSSASWRWRSHEISHRPEGERRELVGIYEKRGVDPTVARTLADEMMRTPELALETHAREELGIDPAALGRPLQAAVSSFATFALGALLPLVPWLFARGTAAVVASVVVSVRRRARRWARPWPPSPAGAGGGRRSASSP